MTDFSALADIFVDPDIFGEPVIYVSAATGKRVGGADSTINAIWDETSTEVAGEDTSADARAVIVAVRIADVEPRHHDRVTRVKTGETMVVVSPITFDRFTGMAQATLAATC